jgi:putative membrane protein
MGLANLVPGISGGTMLVAAGVYRRFVDAVSDASRLRLSVTTLATLALIGVAAAAAIALGSGPVSWGLTHHRWAMYALFIGLTIGGVPALWALVRPASGKTILFALAGLLAMLVVVFLQESGVGASGGGAGSSWLMLALAGAAGAAAMVLPGVSGAYLLLLLGQYETVVAAIKDLARLDLAALAVVIPVGVGVLVGIAGVSNLLRWLLHRYEKPTLAVLLGLLLGAPAGLYPFRQPIALQPGDTFEGQILTEEAAPDVEPKDWPTRAFTPTGLQIAASLGLATLGCAATMGVARLGRRKDRGEPPAKARN